jgi:hypothetical protein
MSVCVSSKESLALQAQRANIKNTNIKAIYFLAFIRVFSFLVDVKFIFVTVDSCNTIVTPKRI